MHHAISASVLHARDEMLWEWLSNVGIDGINPKSAIYPVGRAAQPGPRHSSQHK